MQRNRIQFRKAVTVGLAGLVTGGAIACGEGGESVALSPLAQQGEAIYQSVCIACHNGDPNKDGALGPANAGASEALLLAKIVNGTYPEGYTPKRPDSSAMPRFPYLEKDIPALAAYLAEVERDAP